MDFKGLSSQIAQERLKTVGLNVLVAQKAHRWYEMLFAQFKDLMVLILIGASLISFMHDKTESLIIISIVILNAAIGFIQEFRAEKTLEALKNMMHPQVRVIRDGEEQTLGNEYLVPGDIVLLGEGDKVAADGILKVSHNLAFDESVLTGESVPLEKKVEDRVFMGTSVAKGSGIMEIVSTGMKTEFGKIAQLTTSTKNEPSPLELELRRIGVFVTKITGVVCLFLFVVQFFRSADLKVLSTYTQALSESLIFAVSVAIAAVPEGLPTTITVALALGASVLARKKAIVKRLSAVETLGAVSTICSDKTGTLTKNEMTVRSLYLANDEMVDVSGVGYDPHLGHIRAHDAEKVSTKVLLNIIADVCVYCNEAKLVNQNGHYSILGDPTEGALLTFAEKYQKQNSIREMKLSLQDVFPFDSDRKMMSVVAQPLNNRSAMSRLLVKGSPDQVLENCTHYFDGKKVLKLDKKKLKTISEAYRDMAEKALRVLALAYREIPQNLEKDGEVSSMERDLVFCGLIGMIDPPREEVKEAVKKCHQAGIRVVVITGDYGVTAQAIATELGIITENENASPSVKVLTGDEVKTMSDKALSGILKDRTQQVIFARSLPEQKMRIVRLLQQHGEIVSMTGDGVNDAPALKKANIGVAMGITGTEVSKEAATMILTNDSFASIVTAVEEGRRIYENLKKFVWFIFSCNIGELFVIFASILFVFPLPLTAVLILCIDLGTDILPAIALGVDPAEKGIMDRHPRDTSEKVMNKKFVQSFVFLGSVIGFCVVSIFLYALTISGWSYAEGGGDLYYARTMAFSALVVVQLVNAFSARSFTQSVFVLRFFENKFLILGVMISTIMVGVMLYVPFFNQILKTTPLSWEDGLMIGISSLVPLFVLEVMKYRQRQALD